MILRISTGLGTAGQGTRVGARRSVDRHPCAAAPPACTRTSRVALRRPRGDVACRAPCPASPARMANAGIWSSPHRAECALRRAPKPPASETTSRRPPARTLALRCYVWRAHVRAPHVRPQGARNAGKKSRGRRAPLGDAAKMMAPEHETEEKEVTAADQANINEFSRLNVKFHEIEEDLKAKQEWLVNLQDSSNEVCCPCAWHARMPMRRGCRKSSPSSPGPVMRV